MSADPPGHAAQPREAAEFQASPGQLDVWCIDLDLPDGVVACCEPCLEPSERLRAGRFRAARDRRRYSVAHAALRWLLSRHTGRRPHELRFAAGPQGKPMLEPGSGDALSFNLSRSGDLALIGITAGARLGLDVEQLRVVEDAAAIARSLFSPGECSRLAALGPEGADAGFLACWTRKEAFVKALGAGLSFPLDRFEVTLGRDDARLLRVDGDAEAARRWHLVDLDPAPGYIGAAALDADVPACRLRRLDPDWPRELGRTG